MDDQITPLFIIIFSSSFAFIMFLIGLWCGHSSGKHKGKIEEIKDRISRDIIENIKKHDAIPNYYSKKDIEEAKKYGKRIGFLFSTNEPKTLKLIKGRK